MPFVLQELASQDYPDRSVSVFNLGVRGDDLTQEAERYRRLHDAVDLDVLVLVAYLNDFSSENPAYTLADIYNVGFESGFWQAHSLAAAHLSTTIRNRIVRYRAIAHYRDASTHSLARDFSPYGQQLLELRAYAETRGVKFRVVFFPWLFELDDYPVEGVHEHFAAFAKAHGFPFLDLLTVFRGMDADTLRVSAANEHPNPAGHRIAAEAILKFIEKDISAL